MALAVSIGMVAAAKLSVLTGTLNVADQKRITDILISYGMPTEIPKNLDRAEIKRYLKDR